MADFRQALQARAFRRIRGADYNRAREEIEAGREPGVAVKLFYEVILDDDVGWEAFRDRTFPRFARYLRDKKHDPESPRGVLVAVFANERCLLLHGPDFVSLLTEIEGLNAAALHFRVLQWLTD
ncbi:MAG: hypothetical protein JXR83_03780 [Deltaproteobacteria bacterium]|nr:hypothetical protein [Deltaproteobacteria bacterium]